jgi:hypothetical protein
MNGIHHPMPFLVVDHGLIRGLLEVILLFYVVTKPSHQFQVNPGHIRGVSNPHMTIEVKYVQLHIGFSPDGHSKPHISSYHFICSCSSSGCPTRTVHTLDKIFNITVIQEGNLLQRIHPSTS